jgi:Leucine-rich repeat (LRR) protein
MKFSRRVFLCLWLFIVSSSASETVDCFLTALVQERYKIVVDPEDYEGCSFPIETVISTPTATLSNERNEDILAVDFNIAKRISFLPNNLYEVFPNLEAILVSFTNLKVLTKRNLRNLSKLQQLEVDHSRLKEIDENAFESVANLMYLELSYSSITHFPQNVFAKLTKLKMLLLKGNKVSALNPKLFDNNQDLTELRLSDNRIKTIERGTFDRLTKLEILDLSYNQLSQLSEDIFEYNSKITELHLDHNKFTRIEPNFLVNLNELSQVHLCGNSMEIFDFGVFSNNLKLKKVYCVKCEIRQFKNVDILFRKEKSFSDLRELNFEENICVDEVFRSNKTFPRKCL